VSWTEAAEEELTEIYVSASEELKPAVTEAGNQLDKELERDAHLKGKPFDGDRLLRIHPLMAFFTVNVSERTVLVLRIALNP